MFHPQEKLEINKTLNQDDLKIVVDEDEIDPKYKTTAFNAAREMPKQGSVRTRSKFVYDQLKKAHPNVAWGVYVKNATSEETNSTFWYSTTADWILSFSLSNLKFTVVGLKQISDE